MRFFHGLVLAFLATLSLSVTETLAQSEEQVYLEILHLSDAATELRFSISQITDSDFPAAIEVGVYIQQPRCLAKAHSLNRIAMPNLQT